MNTSHSKPTLHIVMLISLLISLIGGAVFVTPARAAGMVVNSLADNTTLNGKCTLREAIQNAESNAATNADCVAGSGADTITFSVSGYIWLASTLPAIFDAAGLTIDGTGQTVTVSGNGLVRVAAVGSGSLTLDHLTIVSGSSSTGGGISNDSRGTLTVMNSTFSSNSAPGSGGGGIYNGGTATITNSTFSANSAGTGGGIYNSGTLTVTNSTFSNNGAGGTGGGIYNFSGAVATITNSTFSGNHAGGGGGIANSAAAGSTVTLRNTIIANSTTGGNCGGTITDGGNNLQFGGLTANSCGATITTADPKLGPLADNGGPTRTFALLTGSPAIDAGNDAICAAAPVSNTSQNNIPRPQGAHCDIGSYEANATLTFQSVGAWDGWILESAETGNAGGTLDSAVATFSLGDDAADKQYRAVLHFNTSTLPDTAVITKATLKIRKHSVAGTDPFTILGGLQVDIRKPNFGASAGLVTSDFQATADGYAATFSATPVANWYSAILNATGRSFINLTGTTQFRLRFDTDDNDNLSADYMKFFSGDYTTASARPTLVIEYYVP